jgi:hypothetical protein
MKEHWQYLKYIARHKWFVFLAACRLGIPWLGLIHDLSKLRPDEWQPYKRYFYGKWPKVSEMSAGEKSVYFGRTQEVVDAEFDEAWLAHIHRNKHHWQYWVLREDSGAVKCLPMPHRYVLEMLADWIGAGKAQGYGNNTLDWYAKNRAKMQMHPTTREWVEDNLPQ